VSAEESRLSAFASSHQLDNAAKLVKLYTILSKLRLFAPEDMLVAANDVMERLLQTYAMPEADSRILTSAEAARNLDLLRTFSEVCRKSLLVQ